jgi:hypothetical protein
MFAIACLFLIVRENLIRRKNSFWPLISRSKSGRTKQARFWEKEYYLGEKANSRSIAATEGGDCFFQTAGKQFFADRQKLRRPCQQGTDEHNFAAAKAK